ncbi:21163_t:CDS:2 [Entrophospora sp. SA101]|nr:21163_t:CDS:2 [Entrophospora sp. SA101]
MIKNIHKEKLKYKEFVISCAKEKKLFAFFENDNCLSESDNSYDERSDLIQVKEKIKLFCSRNPNMMNISTTVSKMVDKTTLKFTDILSYGTLFENSLQKNHSKIYQHLVKERLVEDLKPIGIQTKIELNDFQQQFIYNCVVFGDILIPDVRGPDKIFYMEIISFINQMKYVWDNASYQEGNSDINERSYSHHVVKTVVKFLFLDVKNVEQRYDGTLSQSTKFRNDQDNEISYGPFSPDNKHTEEDLFRLCKFANDAWKHVFYFVEKFEDNKEILELLNQLEIILLHFHGTTLDVYLQDRKLRPFNRIMLYFSINIPIISESGIIQTANDFIGLCENLGWLHEVLLRNVEIIKKIDNLIKGKKIKDHKSCSSEDEILISTHSPEYSY